MGRYYTGDIEGKFGFGCQASDAADQFGSHGEQPTELHYYFHGLTYDIDKDGNGDFCVPKLQKLIDVVNMFISIRNDQTALEYITKAKDIKDPTSKEALELLQTMGQKVLKPIELDVMDQEANWSRLKNTPIDTFLYNDYLMPVEKILSDYRDRREDVLFTIDDKEYTADKLETILCDVYLGMQIFKCVLQQGYCQFVAEC